MPTCDFCKLNPSGKMNTLAVLTRRPAPHCPALGAGCRTCPNRCGKEAMYIGGMNACGEHLGGLMGRLDDLKVRLPSATYGAIMEYSARDEVPQREITFSGLARITDFGNGPEAGNLQLDDAAIAYPHTWSEMASYHAEDGLSFARLSYTENMALQLFYFEGQSYAAIGRAMGISSDGIEKKVLRAKKKLAEFYGLAVKKMEKINHTNETMGGFWDPEEAAISRPVLRPSLIDISSYPPTSKTPTVDSWLEKYRR
jgi:predicted DNA-binding protein (UPF0251 family)